MELKPMQKFTLDDYLRSLGKFGRYQIFIFVSVCLLIIFAGSYPINFIFTAANVNYRCQIPECGETQIFGNYMPEWLDHAVPFEDGKPNPCLRYKFINKTNDFCTFENFDRDQVMNCEDIFFDDYEKTIATEVGMILLFTKFIRIMENSNIIYKIFSV